MSCVAICEYIDDPSCVKVRKGENVDVPGSLQNFNQKSFPENAKNSDIPQSYLLITNNEVVRVRYILVYGSKNATAAAAPPVTANQEVKIERTSGFFWWCRKNPLIVSAFLYVSVFHNLTTTVSFKCSRFQIFLLFLVGASNHRAVEYYKNIAMDFVRNRFKFL